MHGGRVTRWIRWAGLAVVLAAAAVLSFHGLRDLALAVSIPDGLAWLLPVAVDAGAAVSCACWLSRELPADAVGFARWMTWLLLGGTVVGNAAQLGMHASGLTPPWWVAVAVGAIPPAVVGGTVHLAVLVGRTHHADVAAPHTPVGASGCSPVPAGLPPEPVILRPRLVKDVVSAASAKPAEVRAAVTDDKDGLEEKVRTLLAKGMGRPAIAKELGVEPHEVRPLVEKIRPPVPRKARA